MENTSTVDLLKSLEAHYLKNEFQETQNLLLKAKDNYPRSLFHYNLGTVQAKAGEMGAARYNVEKSLKLGFYNSKSLNNLNYIKNTLSLNDLSTSTSYFDRGIDYLLLIPGDFYLTASLILVLMFTVAANFFRKIKIWVSVLVLLIALLPIGVNHFLLKRIHHAIVLKDIPVYEGPSKIYEKTYELPEGSKIIIGDKKKDWFFIKYPISLSGWVERDNLGIF